MAAERVAVPTVCQEKNFGTKNFEQSHFELDRLAGRAQLRALLIPNWPTSFNLFIPVFGSNKVVQPQNSGQR